MLLGYLKKSWDVLLSILKLLWKYKTYVLIILTCLYILFLRSEVSNSQLEKERLNSEYTLYKEDVEHKRVEALNKAKEQEIQILNKQKQVEKEYAKQIKDLNTDVANAHSANNSLSKKLASNTEKLSRVTEEQARAYTKSLSVVLEDSATRYREMAGEADTKRLAEERCVGLYNALVDAGNNTQETKE